MALSITSSLFVTAWSNSGTRRKRLKYLAVFMLDKSIKTANTLLDIYLYPIESTALAAVARQPQVRKTIARVVVCKARGGFARCAYEATRR